MTTNPLEVYVSGKLPARNAAAGRVLALLDDPDAAVLDVVNALGGDPALATKVLALANSSFYGLSERVASLQFAVAVLGFQTVRAIAVSVVTGLGSGPVPEGFWDQAVIAAAAANVIAPMVGASAPDAFSIGLLHTLGAALLHQQSPLPALCLPFGAVEDLYDIELATYGIGHAEITAEVLAGWHFPARLCEIIADHHRPPLPDADPLACTLSIARSLTNLVLAPDTDREMTADLVRRLSDGAVTADHIDVLLERITRHAGALLVGLGASSGPAAWAATV